MATAPCLQRAPACARARRHASQALARAPAHQQQPWRSSSRRWQRWRRCAASSGASSGSGSEGESVDIDALASKLAAEAERLRRTGSFASGDYDDGPAGPATRRQQQAGSDVLRPFGYEVGDGPWGHACMVALSVGTSCASLVPMAMAAAGSQWHPVSPTRWRFERHECLCLSSPACLPPCPLRRPRMLKQRCWLRWARAASSRRSLS